MVEGDNTSGGTTPRVVLVTGASRFLGGYLVTRLAQNPSIERVIAVDAVSPSKDMMRRMGRAEFVRADIRNPLIGKVIRNAEVDTVVHASTLQKAPKAGSRAAMKGHERHRRHATVRGLSESSDGSQGGPALGFGRLRVQCQGSRSVHRRNECAPPAAGRICPRQPRDRGIPPRDGASAPGHLGRDSAVGAVDRTSADCNRRALRHRPTRAHHRRAQRAPAIAPRRGMPSRRWRRRPSDTLRVRTTSPATEWS